MLIVNQSGIKIKLLLIQVLKSWFLMINMEFFYFLSSSLSNWKRVFIFNQFFFKGIVLNYRLECYYLVCFNCNDLNLEGQFILFLIKIIYRVQGIRQDVVFDLQDKYDNVLYMLLL